MRSSPQRVAVVKLGLQAQEEVIATLAKDYDIVTVESTQDLAKLAAKSKRPDILVMAADLRLHPLLSGDADAFRLLDQIVAGKWGVAVVTITDARSAWVKTQEDRAPLYDSLPRDGVNIYAPPIDTQELRRAVTEALYRRRYRRRARLNAIAPPVLIFAFLISMWEMSCKLLNIREYILPAPSRIALVLAGNAKSLLFDTGVTFAEALLGFLIANVLSLLLAIGFSHSQWLERSLFPYTIALKSVPVVAMAPLLVLWLGYGLWGKIVMAAIIAFFPLVVNATLGLKAVDSESLDLMRSLSASSWQILIKLRFPTAVPYILSALKISSTMAVVGAIIGELTGAKRGIGYVILISSYNLDTPTLFAAIVLASAIGILFFGGMVVLEKTLGAMYLSIDQYQQKG